MTAMVPDDPPFEVRQIITCASRQFLEVFVCTRRIFSERGISHMIGSDTPFDASTSSPVCACGTNVLEGTLPRGAARYFLFLLFFLFFTKKKRRLLLTN